MIADGRLKPGSVGLNCVMLDGGDSQAIETLCVAGDSHGNILKLKVANDDNVADDLTGQALDPALCKAARKLEMEYARGKGFWSSEP